MATSHLPRSASPASNPTRQQLDELDALLQRMLDLPVNKLDDLDPDGSEASPPVSYAATDAEAPPSEGMAAPAIDFQALKQRLAVESAIAAPPPAQDVGETQTKAEGESWVPLSSTWQPSALTWKPLARSWNQPSGNSLPLNDKKEAGSTEADFVPSEQPMSEPATLAAPQSTPMVANLNAVKRLQRDTALELLDTPAEWPVARWATVLVWFNQCFDLWLAPFGSVGRFLRVRPGRLGLAILGLGCLVAAAVVLLIDWFDWTS